MSAIGRRWTAPEEVKVETAFDIFNPLREL